LCIREIHSFRRCYTRFGAYPNYIQIKMFVKTTCKGFQRKRKKENSTDRASVRARVFNAGLLAASQFASGRSHDGPTRSRFSLVPEQMPSWYPNSTLHCMLHMRPSGTWLSSLGESQMRQQSMVTGSARLGSLSDCTAKLQTRPLVRKGAPQKQDRNFQTATFRQEVISGRKSQSGLDSKT
jgi:hypothetical protein